MFPPEPLGLLDERCVTNQAWIGVAGSDGGSAGMANSYYYEQGVVRSDSARKNCIADLTLRRYGPSRA